MATKGIDQEDRDIEGVPPVVWVVGTAVEPSMEGLYGDMYAISVYGGVCSLAPVAPDQLRKSVHALLEFARDNPRTWFWIPELRCWPACYTPDQLGEMFKDAPPNVLLPDAIERAVGVR